MRTWQGFRYTPFVTDVCTKKIVGWAVAATMRTEDLPLQAFNHAVWQQDSDLSELVHHSDRGSPSIPQYVFTETLMLAGLNTSVGTVGDPLDNALAETTIGLYKTECVRESSPFRNGPVCTLTDLDDITSAWVHWYNTSSLMHRLGRRPPAEAEAEYYANQQAGQHTGHT